MVSQDVDLEEEQVALGQGPVGLAQCFLAVNLRFGQGQVVEPFGFLS